MRKLVVFMLGVALALGTFASSCAAAPEKRVALVIGNAAYSGISPLQKPLNDARKMAELLRGLNYEVILGLDASKRDLDGLAQRFRAALKGADVGFFFYSGHGFQTNRIEQQHPINHIVPVDFNVHDASTAPGSLALDVIIEAIRSQARVGFIFMDACRNDPQLTAASERLASNTRSVTIARGFAPVAVIEKAPAAKASVAKGPTGLLIAYATDPGNVALEGETGALSPFTGALTKHLIAPGLSAAEIMGRVSAEVSAQTRGQQTPWNVSSLTAGTYQFTPRPPAPPTTGTAKAPAARPGGTSLPPNLGVGVGSGL
ncbi:MAG TPA: caspase family protein [Hyphomicrobiaceae bacterium]|nr:caspase family protein [Hyphomicrobiaceae bacterium]